jgi:hypothetical protein
MGTYKGNAFTLFMGNPTGRLIGRCGHKWEDDTFYRNKM